MTARNTYLGNTNYTDGEALTHTDLNDTNDDILETFLGQAELSVRVLQSNNVYVQGPNFLVDEMTDSTGTLNTINTSTTTAYYYSTAYEYLLDWPDEASAGTDHSGTDAGSWADIANAFDGNDSTYAVVAYTGTDTDADAWLGKTFTSKHIMWVRYKATKRDYTSTSQNVTIKLQSYNGSTWSDEATHTGNGGSATGGGYSVTSTFYLNKEVQGLRIYFDMISGSSSNSDKSSYLYTLEYGDYDTSSIVVADTNTISLDGNEKGFVVSVPDSTFPTNTSMTVTISDGTNSLDPQTIDTTRKAVLIGNGTAFGGPLSSGTLEVTFTLSTTDPTVTPTLLDYGIRVIR